MITTFNREEFLCFYYLCAAKSDLEIHAKEISYIQTFVNDEIFNNVLEVFQEMNDFQRIERVLEHKSLYFSTQDEIDMLLEKAKGIIESDKVVRSSETLFYMLSKRILEK